MDFNFFMPVRVISGEGCVRKYSALLRGFGRRRLIMTSRSAAKERSAGRCPRRSQSRPE